MDQSPKVRSAYPSPLNWGFNIASVLAYDKFKLQTPLSDPQDPISTICFGSCPKFNFKPQPSRSSLSIDLPFSLYKPETPDNHLCVSLLFILPETKFSCLISILKFHASGWSCLNPPIPTIAMMDGKKSPTCLAIPPCCNSWLCPCCSSASRRTSHVKYYMDKRASISWFRLGEEYNKN